MDEIRWSDRLDPGNHSLHFTYDTTDTFPIRVEKPEDSELRRTLFHGKYGTTVYKIQLAITFLGQIVLCTHPHLPNYDAHIFIQQEPYYPREDWELWLGDGHYSTVPNMLTPFRKDRPLTDDEHLFNATLSFYRARVEHINGFIVRHGMFRNRFRGSTKLLTDAIHTTAQMTSIYLHQHPRYPPLYTGVSWPPSVLSYEQ